MGKSSVFILSIFRKVPRRVPRATYALAGSQKLIPSLLASTGRHAAALFNGLLGQWAVELPRAFLAAARGDHFVRECAAKRFFFLRRLGRGPEQTRQQQGAQPERKQTIHRRPPLYPHRVGVSAEYRRGGYVVKVNERARGEYRRVRGEARSPSRTRRTTVWQSGPEPLASR